LAGSTVAILRSVNNTGRFYRNAVTEEVRKIEEDTPPEEMEFGKIAHLMTGQRNRESLAKNGEGENAGNPDNSAWTSERSGRAALSLPRVVCRLLLVLIAGQANCILTHRCRACSRCAFAQWA